MKETIATNNVPEKRIDPMLDINTIIKAAQAISSEIDLKTLLSQIMTIIIETVEAQRVFFILEKNGALIIEAKRDASQSEGLSLPHQPVEEREDLAVAIVNVVACTQKKVILHDAVNEGDFTYDPYVLKRNPKSILCLPLINMGILNGILYLENNLAVAAFTPERVNILDILATQATISIKNAYLFEQTLQSEIKTRQLNENLRATIAELESINQKYEAQNKKLIESQDALLKSAAHFRKMIEKSPVPIVITDKNQDIEYFNDKFSELFGYTLDDVSTAEKWWSMCYPDETYRKIVQQSWIDAIEKAEQHKRDIEMQEWEFTIKDGSTRVSEFFMVPFDDFSLIIMNDVTERKQIEAAMRQSEEKFRATFEQAGGYCMILDPNSADGIPVIVDANEAACVMHGYTREDFIGRPVADIDDDDGKKLIKQRTAEIMTGKPFYVENIHVRQDGTSFPVAVNAKRIDIGTGQPLILTTEYDITERRQAEEQIRNHNALLEKAVQEKTKEMESLTKQLLRQEKLATIGQISGSIAHELRNPLGAVKNSIFYLKRLQAKGLMEASQLKVSSHLALIETELETSNRIIDDLLQFSHTNAPNSEVIDLRKITVEAAQLSHAKNQLQVKFNLKPDPFLILADSRQFRQLLLNILTNAMQAVEAKALVTITARLLAVENQVQIQIQDNGPGLDPEVVSKVFEPLFSTKATGTGLGLSICKQIIENHSGTLALHSQVGQGTVVEILLPNHNRFE